MSWDNLQGTICYILLSAAQIPSHVKREINCLLVLREYCQLSVGNSRGGYRRAGGQLYIASGLILKLATSKIGE